MLPALENRNLLFFPHQSSYWRDHGYFSLFTMMVIVTQLTVHAQGFDHPVMRMDNALDLLSLLLHSSSSTTVLPPRRESKSITRDTTYDGKIVPDRPLLLKYHHLHLFHHATRLGRRRQLQ